MNIVCTIDGSYIRHCAVMLRSLSLHNNDQNLNVYVIHQKLDPSERAKFVEFVGSFLPSLSMIQIDHSVLQGFPVFGHISIATYFRLLMPSMLPSIFDRVLFLDSDIIISDSLTDFWTMDLQGLPLAAATDRNLDMQRQRLNMGADSPYFNAGVMLIDLDKWRNENILERGLAFARDHGDKLNNWDQDVLNHLFENRVTMIHQRWNAMSHLWGLDPAWLKEQGSLTPEEQEAHDNPAVIHFAGGGYAKPWNYRCTHPHREEYRQLLKTTPWAEVGLDDTPPSDRSNPLLRVARKAKSVGRSILKK